MGFINILESFVKTFSIFDLLDIIIVAFLIYNLIKIIRESRAGQLVKGIMIILGVYFLSCQFNFRMLSALLSNFFQFSIFGILIVFQPELRRVLEKLGRSKIIKWVPINSVTDEQELYNNKYEKIINIVSDSVISLSDERMGALIVFERETKLGEIIDTGTILKSVPSVPLVCNIFYNKSPLHDGALVIKEGLLYAGGCILPLTKNRSINKDLGTRHRAAIGITENSDAVSIVVSEETGKISIVTNGVLKTYQDINMFRNSLKKLILKNINTEKHQKILFNLNNFRKK